MGTGSSGSRRRSRPSPAPRLSVLRVGHRPGRDPRLSTHVALVARAFGADRLYLHPPDPALARRISQVSARFGGSFEVEGTENWKTVVRQFDGVVVHLTMYGLPMDRLLPRLRRAGRILLVVGGAKVPNELYSLATHNLAVGHQPHSEVGALAVVLSSLRGTPGPGAWPHAQHEIVPRVRGKLLRAVHRASP